MNIEKRSNAGALLGAVVSAAAALSGCGGDGSGSTPAGTSTGPLVATAANCDTTVLQSAVPNAVLTAASAVTASTGGTYCRVDGYVATQGPATTTNQVHFMVALPASFQARYYFAGEGGSAGYLPAPDETLLAAGYAYAGSDAGSPTPGIDWAFAYDRTKAYDYAQRGVHVSTAATQAVVRAYYGLPAQDTSTSRKLYRYIDGCSGGGRMGIVAASWYPADFDGVIAGAPGLNVNNQLFFGKVSRYLIDHPDAWISPAQFAALDAALVAKYDAADGAVDGLISDTTNVTLDDSMWAMFTTAQQALLHILVDGMNDFGQTYPGYTLGNPNGWSAFLVGSTAPPWSMTPSDNRLPPAGFLVFDTTSRGLFGPTYDFSTQFSFDNPLDVNGWDATFESVFIGSGTAKAANLNGFFQRGGKMLFWQGTADNGISLNDTIRFFGDLATAQGGTTALAKSSELFVVPGIQHCGGGIGPQDVAAQALPALASWVEGGAAPAQLVANRVAGTDLPARTFLLCPYPQRASFKGGVANSAGLDVNDASNWTCQTPS